MRGRRPGYGHDRGAAVVDTFRWIDSASELAALVDELAAEPAYGLDTEFHRERSYFPRVAMVQVGWRGGVALVDPLAVDVRPLAAVLRGDGLMVAHAAQQDLEALDRACGSLPARLFDTQLAAGFLGFGSPSLSHLVDRLLGVRLVKGDQLADWTRRPLGDAVLAYAADDVAHLLGLHAELARRLEERSRLAWAESECAELLARGVQRPDPDEAWWRIKGARRLRAAHRGVAQTVAAWRERRAASLDLPARFVLPELALAAIAQKAPRSLDELRRVRGVDERALRGAVADELLAAIEAGRELPPEALRAPPSSDGERVDQPTVTLLAAWVAQRAADLDLDSTLLATRRDLADLVAGRVDARLTRGWRRELVYEPLQQLVRGDAALVVEDGKVSLRSGPSGSR